MKKSVRGETEAWLAAVTALTEGKLYHGMLEDFSKRVGVSRERIRQIAKNAGYIMTRDEPLVREEECAECGKTFPAKNYSSKYCGGKCRKAFYEKKYWTTFRCQVCGKNKKVMRSALQRGIHLGLFCSRHCRGIWFGKKKETHGSFYRQRLPQFQEEVGIREFTGWEFVDYFGYASIHSAGPPLTQLLHEGVIRRIRRNTYQFI